MPEPINIVEEARAKAMQDEFKKRVDRIRALAMAGLQAFAAEGASVDEAILALEQCQKLVRGRVQKRLKLDEVPFKDLLNDYAEEEKPTGITA